MKYFNAPITTFFFISCFSGSIFANGLLGLLPDEGITITSDEIATPNIPVAEAIPAFSSDDILNNISLNTLEIDISGSIDNGFVGQVVQDISNIAQRISDPLLAGKIPGIIGDNINKIIESDLKRDFENNFDQVGDAKANLNCQIMTPPTISLNFDNESTSVVKRQFNISVLCPEGSSYGIKSISRGQEKSRFVMLMKNEERRIPAIMDVRHLNGQSLDGLTFTGNGEVQTISMQAILLASNGNKLSGDIVPVDPLAIRIERK